MMPTVPDVPSPAAVTAFLRGLDRRARLFATVQAGDAGSAQHALAVVARVFAGEAGQWPIAEWPGQYWRLLLAAPSLRQPPVATLAAQLPGIARLPAETRAAVLLHLVAGLDDVEAAASLGIDTQAYQARIRDALPRDAQGQPDVDVWRAWRAATERELARMPEPAAPPVANVGAESTLRGKVDAAPPSADARHHVRLRWLWAGVALCIVAMIATFFLHPRGREVLDQWRTPIKREPLDAAAAPRARFDVADIALHPDRELLAAPQELAFARELPLLAWLDDTSADPRAADAVRLPVLLGNLPVPAENTMAPIQRRERWDALSPTVRGAQRGAWQAWRALQPGERVRLRVVGERLRLLAAEEHAALQARFDGLPADVRHGWWLGPQMGRHWPRIAPLFAYAPEPQRAALLGLLRNAEAEDIDALERLAQITPPEERDALRTELLRVPASQRREWILARFQ